MALLDVKNLGISFGGLRAVDKFEIKIEKGQLYGLIGPNGAGKTTVFNLLTGVYKPDDGKIELAGKNITGSKTIDINKAGIRNAIENAKSNNVSNARFYSGDILMLLTKWRREGFTPDVLVVDPPRTGLDIRLINYLQQFPVKKIVYVSCNPATLAKNCNHLQKKYHILNIQPFDMFPETSNVECVVCLELRK